MTETEDKANLELLTLILAAERVVKRSDEQTRYEVEPIIQRLARYVGERVRPYDEEI